MSHSLLKGMSPKAGCRQPRFPVERLDAPRSIGLWRLIECTGAVSSIPPEAGALLDAVGRHIAFFRTSLPLIASENVLSPLAAQMLTTDLHNRYAEGLPGKRFYQGNEFVDAIETHAMALARRLFRCHFVDVRPVSGTVANLAVLFALAKPRELIACPALSDGGHISMAKFGAVGLRGLRSVNYPFDPSVMNFDVDATAKLLRAKRPKLLLFGQSVFLFPVPLRELRDVFDELQVPVWYDAAHVLGLIAGGEFQDPLREGVQVISASTHKTFPGPQHGMILGEGLSEAQAASLHRGVFPGVTSNHHLHAMAALGITLAEELEFGKAYAQQIVRNSRALGQALHERGLKALCPDLGFSASHTVAVDVRAHGGGAEGALRLEQAGIIVNKNLLPWDKDPVHPSGLRLGTQELTRLGMRESQMSEVAELITRVVARGEDPKAVRPAVNALKSGFTKVHYCFGEGLDAYPLPSGLSGSIA